MTMVTIREEERSDVAAREKLLDEAFGQPPYLVVLLRVVDSKENLGNTALRLVDGFLEAFQRVVDLFVRNCTGLGKKPPHQQELS